MDAYNIGEIYSQRTASLLPVAEPIIPILRFISVIHCSSSSSSSSISTGSGSKGGIFVISLLSIPYLRNTSLNSFLVLYEENDLNFFLYTPWRTSQVSLLVPSLSQHCEALLSSCQTSPGP